MIRQTATAVAVALAFAAAAATVAAAERATPPRVIYGSNPAAGAYFDHDGVRLYYEVYGAGPPLLLIHGNGASIRGFTDQIDYFRQKYTVIAMDSRDHGRSSDSPAPLTFEAMSDDLDALLDHLHTGPAYLLGWSDGAIEALLLGMRHPDKVKMIAAMAANLDPAGAYPEFLESADPPRPTGAAPPPPPTRALRVKALDRDEPHIRPEALEAITAPTLVLAGDHDAIRDDHTLLIYHHLRNGQLAILPDATHMIPIDDPPRFNATVDRFFSTPFVRKDRLLDLLKTLQRVSARMAAEN